MKVLISNKIFFVEKKFKNFADYLFNDHRVTPIPVMVLKAIDYVKSYDGHSQR